MTCNVCGQPVYLDEGRVSVVTTERGTVVVHVDCLKDDDDD